ncbi:organic hydroperoxide resistance protein [Streptomyces phaeoluteigriseus]|uniref:organic hydroperoxide resistance protein n=1 Tax=Streptomyces phaeoluteigriseus TaxID=114686 RepID=UPI0025ABA2ED|nr:organic hydroperoxide resistance protein [Streptomyces phaeoluteigriseus]
MTEGAAVDTVSTIDTADTIDTRPTKIVYVAEATAHGGRDGYVTSQDGQIELKVAMPPELGGDGNGTNPEQLFAAGYSSCFHNALILVGNRAGFDLTGSTVAAKVGIGPNSTQGYGLAVALSVSLPVLDADLAGKLVAAAHQVCPYSNATRGNIDVTILLG